MKHRKFFMISLIIIIVCNIITAGLILYSERNRHNPKPYYVTDKAESKGRCYVQTWVEVTPEDYIGLDVGDEFEVTK